MNDGPKLFDNFKLVVEEGAVDHWETFIDGKALTVNTFNACVERFHVIYSSSVARDIIYQYLASSKCNRPKEIEVIDQKCCMETLFRYADRLVGMQLKMAENMKKKTLHVLAYKSAGGIGLTPTF